MSELFEPEGRVFGHGKTDLAQQWRALSEGQELRRIPDTPVQLLQVCKKMYKVATAVAARIGDQIFAGVISIYFRISAATSW